MIEHNYLRHIRSCRWVWVCPVPKCHAVGQKPLPKHRARRRGREHVEKYHNIVDGFEIGLRRVK